MTVNITVETVKFINISPFPLPPPCLSSLLFNQLPLLLILLHLHLLFHFLLHSISPGLFLLLFLIHHSPPHPTLLLLLLLSFYPFSSTCSSFPRLSSEPSPTISALSTASSLRRGQHCRRCAATSSHTPTVTTTTGAAILPPDRFTSVLTECWRPH